ncbi:MAG: protein kinase, partial [Chloroflexota bacterium]
MAPLSLSLFGAVQATLAGQIIESFRTNKVQALLIYIAVEPGAHSREKLTDLLWPGMPERSARHNLRQTLYHLRTIIPDPVVELSAKDDEEETIPLVVANRLTIELNPAAGVQVDVHRFQQLVERTLIHEHPDLLICSACQKDLEEAADLYADDFLSDFYLEDSNQFEEWAQVQRELYRRENLDVLGTLTTIFSRRKEYAQAMSYAQRQLEIDNLRESAYRQLMEVLALMGRREEALSTYEKCRRLLAEELAMAPSKRTSELYDKILAGDLSFDSPPEPGVRGYDLKDEIGEGAYGSIRRAVQPAIGREVAVKVIRRKYASDPEFIRRFEAEAQTVARLEHPHIVPLYDYWRDPDGAYLVMRYLRGGSLLSALQAGPWDVQKTANMLDQLAAALSTAHRQGVVHRDIKPANILLDESGNAYLTDFGIAKDLTGEVQLTAEGAVIGTPDYISPEQILSQDASPQTDIYSLGAVIYETLTGEKPFPDSSVANLIYKHLNDPVPQVATARPGVPPQVDVVIQRATAKNPTDRYADALEMAEAFRQAASGGIASISIQTPDVPVPAIEVYNPYKGLRAFQEADADDFFGREALAQRLVDRLADSRFLALVGPSGSGKSSAVKAGLIPALRAGALPGSEKWFVAEMTPGSHPLEELEMALWPIAVDPPPSLVEPMQRDNRGLLRTLRRILPDEPNAQLLLVVDQFEELFTQVEDEARRTFFMDSLLQAIHAPRSPLTVVITLRADFYDRPLRYEILGKLLKENTEVILPLNSEELTWAIREPARRVGVRLEEGLAGAIVADLADQPGSLPMLQYALTELFERRRDRRMTLADYRAIGGVLGALGRRAEEIYAGLDEPGQETARQLFLRLVTLGEGAEDTRRRVLHSELEAIERQSLKVENQQQIIQQYGAARLFTFDHDPVTRQPTVEVAHEALLREWKRLRSWLDQSRADVRLQRLLATSAAEWRAAGHDPGFLLRDARLEQFAGWAETATIALTGDEQAFLQASLDARAARLAQEEVRLQRELETAQRLAETEHARAEEQAQAAGRLRQRAVLLAGALAIAAIL